MSSKRRVDTAFGNLAVLSSSTKLSHNHRHNNSLQVSSGEGRPLSVVRPAEDGTFELDLENLSAVLCQDQGGRPRGVRTGDDCRSSGK